MFKCQINCAKVITKYFKQFINKKLEILDTDSTDLLQINETDCLDRKDENGLTRVRSLIDNMQLQIQLCCKSGAKVWPNLYQMPGLLEKLSVKTMDKTPLSRQKLVLRQLYSPIVQYCPIENVQLGAEILHDVICKYISQNLYF